jgi:tetratricopeptide (TPR) repeat protein
MKTTIFLLLTILAFAGCSDKNTRNAGSTPKTDSGASGLDATLLDKPSQARALVEKGNELYRNDQDSEAVAAFEQAVQIDPDFAEAHFRLGVSYAVLGRKAESQQQFKHAAELYENEISSDAADAEAHYNLGLAYNKLGEPENAVKALKQAVVLDPENAEYYFELGVTHNKLAQYQEAVAALQKVSELEPENYRAQEALEVAQNGVQRRQAALKQVTDDAKKKTETETRIQLSNTGLPPILKKKNDASPPNR